MRKETRTLKSKKCEKCGEHKITKHHILPVCHFGRKKNRQTINLCPECHARLEQFILGCESFIGGCKLGRRFRLPQSDYFRIIKIFLQ